MSVAAPDEVEIPRVQGQHRNRALAKARRIRATQLVLNGHTYQQVADELGYANRGTVHRLVNRPLEAELDSVAVERFRAMERLDALLSSMWSKAMQGDLSAARACRQLIMSQVRLIGALDGPATSPARQASRNCGGHPPTVVIRDDDCRHAGCDIHGKFDSQ